MLCGVAKKLKVNMNIVQWKQSLCETSRLLKEAEIVSGQRMGQGVLVAYSNAFFCPYFFPAGLDIASVCVCMCVYLPYIYNLYILYIYTHLCIYISGIEDKNHTFFSKTLMHNQYAYLHLILYAFCSMNIVKEILLCSSAFTFLKCQLLLLVAF